jgi:phosphatidylserine/phosphatidylglycerophosphate/cardiolipin synthase-like enzyme
VQLKDAFSPHQGATKLIVETIKTAKASIHVAAYSFESKAVANALIAAHKRGVDVKIVLDSKQAGHIMVAWVKENGIDVRCNDHYSIMHDKFMVVDGRTLELGSFNYSEAAEKSNAENVLVLTNAFTIASDYDKQFTKLWDEALIPKKHTTRKKGLIHANYQH